MEKPRNIYTTEETTTRKFSYDKPEGWDKKPPLINPKKYKPKWWQIVRDIWNGKEDIEPKYLMKYDGWMHELKLVVMTVFVTLCIIYITFHSPLIETSAANAENNEKDSWFDKGLDYVLGKYDDWRGITPIIITKPDTIYQVVKDTPVIAPVPLLTQEQLDSIIKSYKLDSIQKLIDSTN